MKKVSGRLIVVTAFVALTANSLLAQYVETVKFMTYNINAEGHGSGSYSDIATVLKTINPAICGMQKLDSCNSRNSQYVLKFLGEQTEMNYTFAAAQTNFQGSPGSYGIGFLSRSEPKSVRRLSIPKGSASEDRAALEIGITMGGEPVRVIVTHLDYANATNRTAQIQKIISWIDSGAAKTVPAVIMADFNAAPTENCMTLLTGAGFVFVKTSGGTILDTTQKINHILYRPEARWKVADAGNPVYTAASNRNPLWALMTLLNPVGSKSGAPANVTHLARPKIAIGDQEIRFNLFSRATVAMRLLAPSGRLVRTFADGRALEAGPQVFALPKKNLTTGMYLLESTINGASSTDKIAVVR
jgi:endonuclease/exonuclease/phosphatase family metal-dependent hydrolase